MIIILIHIIISLTSFKKTSTKLTRQTRISSYKRKKKRLSDQKTRSYTIQTPPIFYQPFIPDTAKEKPSQGEVVAVGPGKLSDEGTRLEMDVSVGNKVLYGKYSGTDVTLDGQEYLILRESDILAIVS